MTWDSLILKPKSQWSQKTVASVVVNEMIGHLGQPLALPLGSRMNHQPTMTGRHFTWLPRTGPNGPSKISVPYGTPKSSSIFEHGIFEEKHHPAIAVPSMAMESPTSRLEMV